MDGHLCGTDLVMNASTGDMNSSMTTSTDTFVLRESSTVSFVEICGFAAEVSLVLFDIERRKSCLF